MRKGSNWTTSKYLGEGVYHTYNIIKGFHLENKLLVFHSFWGIISAVSFDLTTKTHKTRWLLRSLPVPRAVLAEVWADEAWRSWLTDLVVASDDGKVAGFLRAADPGGLGVVDLDGESVTITAERILLYRLGRDDGGHPSLDRKSVV